MSRDKINNFYAGEMEKDRLETDPFLLEGIRTKEIISRYLTNGTLNIADIGGGAGYYAFWLQNLGHQVSLVDLSPKNIELANDYSATSGIKLNTCETGDATGLRFADEQFDMVLLLGPLYHLQDRGERIRAITEAGRILKPDGVVLMAAISRYASLLDGFKRDLVNDDHFYALMTEDLKTGIHINPTGNPEYFTSAYFHATGEIEDEIIAGGLTFEKTIAIESFGWFIDHLKQKSDDTAYMKKLMTAIGTVEGNEDFISISPHIMSVARKK